MLLLEGKEGVWGEFILKEKNSVSEAIQVTYSLKDGATRKREIEGLLEALREFNLKKGVVITNDESDFMEVEGKKIDVIPVWQWRLRD